MNSGTNFLIRRGNIRDLPALEQLYAQARAFMRESGNPDQWGEDKPTLEQIQQDMTMEEAIRVYQDTDEKEKRLGVTKDEIATVDLVRLADCEQQFFGDYQVMDYFKDDPVILQAVQILHQALGEENPVQGMTMGGI